MRNVRKATPPWADRAAIKAIYSERERISAETGIEHHVDHVIPLCHSHVCGLHVPDNLRIIPAAENKAKGDNCEFAGQSMNRRLPRAARSGYRKPLAGSALFRTNIYLPAPLLERLRELSVSTDVSVAELIRRAVESYLRDTAKPQQQRRK